MRLALELQIESISQRGNRKTKKEVNDERGLRDSVALPPDVSFFVFRGHVMRLCIQTVPHERLVLFRFKSLNHHNSQ